MSRPLGPMVRRTRVGSRVGSNSILTVVFPLGSHLLFSRFVFLVGEEQSVSKLSRPLEGRSGGSGPNSLQIWIASGSFRQRPPFRSRRRRGRFLTEGEWTEPD